jgi:hypothetical protein
VSALYVLRRRSVGPLDSLARLVGIKWLTRDSYLAVIESSFHEDIKPRTPDARSLTINTARSVRRMGELGFPCCAYNSCRSSMDADGIRASRCGWIDGARVDDALLSRIDSLTRQGDLPGWAHRVDSKNAQRLLDGILGGERERMWDTSHFLNASFRGGVQVK